MIKINVITNNRKWLSYFKNPEASGKKTDGGWLRMGDVGYKDADGWYYFLYRKGGGIRKNGDFINPAFVEKELAENSQIDDVFVYGVRSANGVPGEKCSVFYGNLWIPYGN